MIDGYIKYVKETVDRFQKYANAIDYDKDAVTPSLIMQFMANFGNVVIMLNAEYQRKKIKYSHEKIDFDQWYSEKLIETKEVMSRDMPKSLKLSITEIESQIKITYKNDYLDKKKKLVTLEHEVSFLKSLIDQWQIVGGMYQAMSNNMRQEMKTFLFEKSIEKSFTGMKEDYRSDASVVGRRKPVVK